MKNIVESVLRSYGHEVSGPLKERLFNYMSLLASAGITDEEILTFGKAYLNEIFATRSPLYRLLKSGAALDLVRRNIRWCIRLL